MVAVLDALFPPRCAGCGRGSWPFCDSCRARLRPIAPPWCARCGRPTERPLQACALCPPPPVDRARAPLLFRGPARTAIHKLKFAGWRTVAEALAAAMRTMVDGEHDAVCWVPSSRARRARRGYDQAGALADRLARLLEMPTCPAIRRVADPGPQARRGGAERRAAMRGAFAVVGSTPDRVLLVDDVLTTGATAGACAEVLAASGVREIVLITAVRAIPGRLPARYTRRDGARPGLWLPGEQIPGSRCQPRAKRPT
ncbi:MAG: ComF family protein [Actinomycetota bacterium]